MYRWQTLTLARVECGLGSPVPPPLLDQVKEFLLHVGLRHFPEPEVGWPPTPNTQGPLASLIWRIDDRELQVTFQPNGGFTSTRLIGGREQKEAGPRPHDYDPAREDAHWLLFGYSTPAALNPSSVDFDRTVGAPLSNEQVVRMLKTAKDGSLGRFDRTEISDD